jgi:hypothetical protein
LAAWQLHFPESCLKAKRSQQEVLTLPFYAPVSCFIRFIELPLIVLRNGKIIPMWEKICCTQIGCGSFRLCGDLPNICRVS